MERKTILVVSPSVAIGGREKIALNTVRCFEQLGYRAVLVVFRRCETEYPFNGERIDLDEPPRPGTAGRVRAQLARARKLRRLRQQYRAECVYSLGEAANIANVLSGRSGCGKTVISLHGNAELRTGFVPGWVYRHADRVVCIAQDMQYRLKQLYPGLENTVVIENGYDLPAAGAGKDTPAGGESLRIAAMGRLNEVKGFDRLITSFCVIRHAVPDAVLTIIGKGAGEEKLKSLVRGLGLRDAVRFPGFLPDPVPVLAQHNMFALTSHEEGFPNALIEAMGCGLPVVASDCPTGPREILSAAYSPAPVRETRTEKYGVLVENSDTGFESRFAGAVVDLWNDPDRRTEYEETCPQRAGDFSLERYRDKLKELLDGPDDRN